MWTAVLRVQYSQNVIFWLTNGPKKQPLEIDGSNEIWTKVMK